MDTSEKRQAKPRSECKGISQEASRGKAQGKSHADYPSPENDAPVGFVGFRVTNATGQAVVQDSGRLGLGSLGVSTSGFFDTASAAAANRLVGNAPNAPAIEVLLGGLSLRWEGPYSIEVAVVGAAGPVTAGGRPGYSNSVFTLLPGDEIHIGHFDAGMRAYVAARGGLVPSGAHPILGSWSTDFLAELGPAAITAGDILIRPEETSRGLNDGYVSGAYTGPTTVRSYPAPHWSRSAVLDVVPGPRTDWFSDSALRAFFHSIWEVSTECNRVGIRLQGPELRRRRHDELASEGMVPGAVQVPAGGQPIIFGPDHPATGGYPVIAVLTAVSLARAAQLGPGDWVRFQKRDLA